MSKSSRAKGSRRTRTSRPAKGQLASPRLQAAIEQMQDMFEAASAGAKFTSDLGKSVRGNHP